MELVAFARPPKKPPNNFVRLAAIPFAVLVLVLVWLAPTVAIDTPGRSYLPATDRLQSVVESTLPSLKVHRYRDDFRKGLADWNYGARAASDWSYEAGAVRPGKLRLWKRSMDMTDYQFEFQAAIEQKAVSWAFRASDTNNYYATKIALGRGDESTGTRIVRYVMMSGVQKDRMLLPSPVEVKAKELYRIRVRVKGDTFSTLVNNQLVDQWHDSRLASGGVGLFAEQGEVASVHWVSIADRETFFSRLFASTLLLTPAASRALPPIE
ncbi:MAG: hypothetical protein NTU83_02885 [Candidatus Hydrogenedentes bacterium]|nr:hypothetical protein [Candidatus Hydrogenedentota bacterium]